jgi:hypothetical protein
MLAKRLFRGMLLLLVIGFGVLPQLSSKAESSGGRSPDLLTASQEVRDLKGLVFEVRPFGFTRTEVTVPDGRYLIVIQNRTGRRDLTFRVDRQGGDRLHEVRQRRLDWRAQVDLHPGTYILSEANHPDWRATITVQPR